MNGPFRQLTVGRVLVAVALLEVGVAGGTALVARTSPAVSVQPGSLLLWLVVDLALVWGIWRRHAAALFVLVLLVALPAVLLLLSLVTVTWWASALLVSALLELVLLLSPQVRAHVRSRRTSPSDRVPTP